MSTIQNKIEQLKQNGYDIDFNETFSDAFETWKKVFGWGALAILIQLIYSWVVNALLGLIPVFSGSQQKLSEEILSNQGDPDALIDAYVIYVQDPYTIGVMILATILGALIFPIFVGVVNVAYKQDQTGVVDINDLFAGFQGDKFGKFVLLGVIYGILKIIGIAFFIVGWWVIAVGFIMASCFILFHDMGVIESIKASFAVAMKNFWTILGLLIVGGLFAFLGIFACGIGVFATAPIMLVLCYTIYKKSVGLDENSEIDTIGRR